LEYTRIITENQYEEKFIMGSKEDIINGYPDRDKIDH
jgi:hypothetical protein